MNRITLSKRLSWYVVAVLALTSCMRARAQEPSSSEKAAQVTRKIESLKAAGFRVDRPVADSLESVDVDALPKQMKGARLATSSETLRSSGSGSWNLILADGPTRVELSLYKWSAGESYKLISAKINGQLVIDVSVGLQPSAPSAAEVGNTYQYVDPVAARKAVDILMLGRMEAVLSGNVNDAQAPRGDRFAPLEPAAADTLLANDEGVTLFFDEEGVLLIVNRGEQVVGVLTAELDQPRGSGIYADPRELNEGGGMRVAVGPTGEAARVCARLFTICLTHEDDLGLKACELWLKYCAPRVQKN